MKLSLLSLIALAGFIAPLAAQDEKKAEPAPAVEGAAIGGIIGAQAGEAKPAAETAPAAEAKPAEAAAPAAAPADLTDPSKFADKAPDKYKVVFETTKGNVTIECERKYSPNGADRFYNMVKGGFFTDIAIFRVVPGFMAQFGIHGDPNISSKWKEANLQDDPVKGSNVRGALCFAKTGAPNSRSTQLFISYGDNSRLDKDGFAPFGLVRADSMKVWETINSQYGESPDQGRIQSEGNAYLKKEFPNLDYIKSAKVVE
jgi:peptidyl-prolyl cis-trans isomerase A (cyclophilin A)